MARAASALIPAEDDIPLEFSKEQYISFRIQGFTPRQAALRAGYRSERDYKKWEEDGEVRNALAAHAQATRREAVYDRDKVMEVVEDAIEIARVQGDARTMIAGAQEFNKMQGHYAPEKREVSLNIEHELRVKQIQEMDEHELLEALDREQPYIDAEFEELPEES